MSPRLPALFLAIAFLGLAALLWLPFAYGVVQLAADVDRFDPDMLLLYRFFPFYDPALFRHDYTLEYYSRLWTSPAFLAMQYLWAQLADPMILHRALPVVLWLSCVPPVFSAGRRLGGLANAWATLAIYLCSSVFLFRMTGGMAHGFGFPFMWWAAAALLSGRVGSLALATVVSAAFYPAVTPLIGTSFALWLLFPALSPAIPQSSPAMHWPWQKKCLLLAATALLAGIFIAPIVFHNLGNDYGPPINPVTEKKDFPEIGNTTATIPPILYTLSIYVVQHDAKLGTEGGQALTLILLCVLVAGLFLPDTVDRRAKSLRPLLYSAGLWIFGSMVFFYGESSHFAVYSLPVLITLFLPVALRRLCRRWLPTRTQGPAFAALVLAYLFCIAQAEPQALGYYYTLEPPQKRALEFIHTLPKDALLAGWPGNRFGKVAEAVPYVARRQILVNWAGHALTHKNYALTMRKRMNAVVDAYLAQDTAPLIVLRDRFAVDYLIVNDADFAGSTPPTYIDPFNQRAESLWKENRSRHFAVLSLTKADYIYSKDGIRIIDLHRLNP